MFFKKKYPAIPVPEWMSFFSPEDYGKFIGLVDSYFKSKKIEYNIVAEETEVITDSEMFGSTSMRLTNLGQMCNLNKDGDWKRIIGEHFEGMRNDAEFRVSFDKQVHSFEYAEPYIGVRIYNSSYLESLDSTLFVGKNISDDLFAMLVFDLPQTISNIRPSHTVQWGKDYEELFEIGLYNVNRKYKQSIEAVDVQNLQLWVAGEDHFFVPNLVFNLEQYPQLVGSKGCLIGIPHRHMVICYPINDLETIQATNVMIPMIHYIHKEGPGSISDSLYWYNNGELIKQPYELTEEKLEFRPTQEFLIAIGAELADDEENGL